MHAGTWNKWREAAKPQDWKIMTKVEHTKRTAEYLALLEKENPKGMRRVNENTSRLPPIARPAALPMNFDPLPEDSSKDDSSKVEDKKKRKRRKPAKTSDLTGTASVHAGNPAAQNVLQKPKAELVDVSEDVQPNIVGPANKKKRKRRKSGKPKSNADHATTDAADVPDDEPVQKRRR